MGNDDLCDCSLSPQFYRERKLAKHLVFPGDRLLAFGVMFLDTCSLLTTLVSGLKNERLICKAVCQDHLLVVDVKQVGSDILGAALCERKPGVMESCTWGQSKFILPGV